MGGLDRFGTLLLLLQTGSPGKDPGICNTTNAPCHRRLENERVLFTQGLGMNYGTRSKMVMERKVSEFYISLVNLPFCWPSFANI